MLKVSGKLLSIIDDSYASKKTGERILQKTLVIMDDGDVDTSKVALNAAQIAGGSEMAFSKLINKKVDVAVSVFAFQGGGHKLNAVGTALPLGNFQSDLKTAV